MHVNTFFEWYHNAVNIALNKPAHQLNQYNAGDTKFDASNAVDGSKSDLSANGGQCVISVNEKQTATWWVNMTRILSIHHIIIYYRTDNVPWGMYIRNIILIKKN